LVALRLILDFTCRFKYGLVLNTKGIQEAIEQRSPIKALNSFALVDRFDGVDMPIVQITSSMSVQVVADSYFATVEATGGLEMHSLIDLYDPYPITSSGLVRPYELLTMSLDPTDWIEFSVEIRWSISLCVTVLGSFSYEYRADDLILRIVNDPGLGARILSCDPESHAMLLLPPYDTSLSPSQGGNVLACTGLDGQNGDETIECVLENPQIAEEQFQRCGRVSHIEAEESVHQNQHFNVLLRDIQSGVNLAPFGPLENLELDYSNRGHFIIVGNSVVVGGSSVDLGEVSLNFNPSLEQGIFHMPIPEQQQLFTTISSECNSAWDIIGYTNLRVKVNEISNGCVVDARGGLMTDFATLIIDYSNDSGDGSSCVENGGNLVIIEESGSDSLLVRFNENFQSERSVTVDRKFGDVRIELSNCDDMVELRSTLDFVSSVTVYGYGGNDIVMLGTDETGVDEIKSNIVFNGGDGNDSLVVNNRGASLPVESSRLTRVSLEGLLPVPPDNDVTSISYLNVEELSLFLPSTGNNRLDIESIDRSVTKTEIVGGATDLIHVIGNHENLDIRGASLIESPEARNQ